VGAEGSILSAATPDIREYHQPEAAMPVFEQGALDTLHEAKRALNRIIQQYEMIPKGVELNEMEDPLLNCGADLDTTIRELFNAGNIAGMRSEVEFGTIYWREHEMGQKPRMRIWTLQQAAYGQFDVVENAEFEILRRVLGNMGYVFQEGDR
jgi:hypothetical protein